MKITKRIFLVLLAAAILVSSMLLSVSAEDTFKAEGINGIEDIMEYYDLPDFLADNYDDGTKTDDLYSGSNSEITADPVDPSNKVLYVKGKANKYAAKSNTDKLVVSYNIYMESAMTGEYKLDVKMIDVNGNETATFNTIFSANMKTKTFQYSAWNPALNNNAGGFELSDFDGIVPEGDKWYKVVIFFNAAEGQYNFKISNDGEQTWVTSENFSLGNFVEMSSFELTTNFQGRNGKILAYLDNVEVYCGSFERSPSNKNNITAQTILDLDALYNAETTDDATKVRIANVFSQLINKYGFVPAEGTPDRDAVLNVIENAKVYVNSRFASEFVSRINNIDTNASYYQRIDYANAAAYYNDVLPENDELDGAPGIDADLAAALVAARTAYDAELVAIDKIKSDSEALVKAMYEFDAESKDYDNYLKGFYATVSAFSAYDVTYNEAIDGVVDYTMTDAANDYNEFVAKYTKLDATANALIDGVTAIENALLEMAASAKGEDAYETAWGVLYENYVIAKAAYADGVVDENLDVTTHAALSAKIEKYLAEEAAIVAEIEICDQFNAIMKKANTATYYTAKIGHLEEAAELVDIVRAKYPGIEYSKALYATLTKSIADADNASEAYINAVNAIANATNFNEKKAAVDAALGLKAEGDVTGVEGVKEANIILSVAAAEIESLISNSEALVAFVAELKELDDLSARRVLIIQAKQAALNSEPTYTGVANAKADLESLITAFTNDVNTVNNAHADSSVLAVEFAGAAVTGEKVYKSSAVIKDFVK